jgi:hypothetical protein
MVRHTGQRGDLADVSARAHDLGGNAGVNIMVEDFAHRLHAQI